MGSECLSHLSHSVYPPALQPSYAMFGSRGRSSSYASITDALPLQRQTVESEVESDPQRKEQLKKLFELMDHHLASGACLCVCVCCVFPPLGTGEYHISTSEIPGRVLTRVPNPPPGTLNPLTASFNTTFLSLLPPPSPPPTPPHRRHLPAA